MVSAPRLHTSAAHPPAGDGNQAIKTWPAVSLYLLVAWLAQAASFCCSRSRCSISFASRRGSSGARSRARAIVAAPDRSTPVTRISEQV